MKQKIQLLVSLVFILATGAIIIINANASEVPLWDKALNIAFAVVFEIAMIVLILIALEQSQGKTTVSRHAQRLKNLAPIAAAIGVLPMVFTYLTGGEANLFTFTFMWIGVFIGVTMLIIWSVEIL